MAIKSIKQLRNLTGKRVLVRVDFNVPIERKKILDDTRLLASLPTIEFLIKNKAKIILISHLGRPDGKIVRSLKMDAIAAHLGKLLKRKVKKLETGNFKFNQKRRNYFEKQIDKMHPGQVVMLDNIRFSSDEEKNTGTLAKEISEFGDIFVMDGFSVAHRASASVVGIAEHLPAYAGLLLREEIKGLERVTKFPKKPFVAIMGGIKVATKAPVIKNLLPKVSYILIGGGILNTYLYARGYKVGDSIVDKGYKSDVLKFGGDRKVILPVDVIVGTKDGKSFRLVDLKKKPHQVCKKGEAIFDIGPQSICLFSSYIKKAQTIVWNGAMGYFEQEPYNIGTFSVARSVASRSKGKAFGVIGGGETIQAMEDVQMSEYMDLISTGGGALLEFLSGKNLPGVVALKKNKSRTTFFTTKNKNSLFSATSSKKKVVRDKK